MKNLPTLIILLMLAFTAQSCESKTQETNENEIKTVSISTFGGRSTIISKTYIITKDSVHYELIAQDSTQNEKKSFANKLQDWENLLKSIDKENFKNAKNGSSYQETDGNDTEITITTTKEKIRKVNGEKSESWNNTYRQLIYIYFKEEKK